VISVHHVILFKTYVIYVISAELPCSSLTVTMNTKAELPDGGWGWAVVAGTAIINIFNQSLLSMFGLIFGGKLESMAGTTGVTTVMSLNCTISNFSGFLISPLSKYFSTKQITQIGVLLVSAGMVLSTYTKSYTRVTLGYGVLTGKLPSFFELFKYLRSLAICGFFFSLKLCRNSPQNVLMCLEVS
jgi:hypothetical protein